MYRVNVEEKDKFQFDFLAVDVTTNFRGYNGDLNDTFYVGKVGEASKKLVQTTHECLSQAIAIGLLKQK